MAVPEKHQFDACIVGAGPAGIAAARALQRSGARVAMVAPVSSKHGYRIGETLPGAAERILRELAFDHLLAESGQMESPGNLSAWGSEELIETDFIADPRGGGWHLDRAAFESALFKETILSGVRHYNDVYINAQWSGGCWVVQGANRELYADWVVDATGRRATFARGQGARRIDDSRKLAVVNWVRARAHDSDRRTVVESVGDAWWYTSLLPNKVRVVVYHGEADTAVSLYRHFGVWSEGLAQTRHIGPRVGSGRPVVKGRLALACGSYLDRPAGRNWFAAGDAALAFDPISSQGMFSAFYAGLRVADAICGRLTRSDYEARLASIRAAYLENLNVAYGARAEMVS